jgi:exopolyphosphatase/guanosine-5'-triphosphate,3'-diphosphate pyrophosphatase
MINLEVIRTLKFPSTIAVIDIGAHSIRMDIIELKADKSYKLLERLAQPVNLGKDVFVRGAISAESTVAVCKIMRDFANKTTEYAIQLIRAFATSAVREAFNREIFINNIKMYSGIDLEILEGDKEAALITLAVKKALCPKIKVANADFILLAIGTGSIEVAMVQGGKLQFAETFALGTIRIFEEYGSKAAEPEQMSEIIDSFTDLIFERLKRMADIPAATKLVAVGESVRNLLTIGVGDRETDTLQIINAAKFEKIFRKVNLVSLSDMAEKYKISDVAAKGIVPCAWILKRFFEYLNSGELIVPAVTTRDAVLADVIRNIFHENDPFIPDMISVVKALAKKYDVNLPHAEAIRKIAVKVFDKMIQIHGLGERDRIFLEIAAIVHDIGRFIDSRKHHKHSCYLISNSQIPGLSEEERRVVAAIARYHRKAKPQSLHPEYMSLPAQLRVKVCKLAAILRVADAAAHSLEQQPPNCSVSINNRAVVIKLGNGVDIALGKVILSRKSDLFEDVYGYKIILQ